jgi:hypothetical protein
MGFMIAMGGDHYNQLRATSLFQADIAAGTRLIYRFPVIVIRLIYCKRLNKKVKREI